MFFCSFTISYSESEYFKQTMRQGGPAKPKEPRIPRMPQLYAPCEAGFLLIVICALLPFIFNISYLSRLFVSRHDFQFFNTQRLSELYEKEVRYLMVCLSELYSFQF